MEKIKEIIKKVLTKEVIFYLIFGVLTTLVNIITFTILTNIFILNENLSKAIAIVFAVLVAYFTNRKWVFNSSANTIKEKFIEFYKFILSRALTMVIEYFGFYLLFNILNIQKDISNISITILVIILNYFLSKFFAFKKI